MKLYEVAFKRDGESGVQEGVLAILADDETKAGAKAMTVIPAEPEPKITVREAKSGIILTQAS